MWTSAWMSVWIVTSCASTPWGHMSVPVKKDTESAVMEEPVSVSSQGIFWVFHKFLPLPALQSAGEENFRTLSPSFRFLSLSLYVLPFSSSLSLLHSFFPSLSVSFLPFFLTPFFFFSSHSSFFLALFYFPCTLSTVIQPHASSIWLLIQCVFKEPPQSSLPISHPCVPVSLFVNAWSLFPPSSLSIENQSLLLWSEL